MRRMRASAFLSKATGGSQEKKLTSAHLCMSHKVGRLSVLKATGFSWRVRALQPAEILVRAAGRRFIPGTKAMASAQASALEACFSGVSPRMRPFSAACLAPGERQSVGLNHQGL